MTDVLEHLEEQASDIRRRMIGQPPMVRERLGRLLAEIERQIADAPRVVRVGDHPAESWDFCDE